MMMLLGCLPVHTLALPTMVEMDVDKISPLLQAGGDWSPAPAEMLKARPAAPGALPTVTAHGMGDVRHAPRN